MAPRVSEHEKSPNFDKSKSEHGDPIREKLSMIGRCSVSTYGWFNASEHGVAISHPSLTIVDTRELGIQCPFS